MTQTAEITVLHTTDPQCLNFSLYPLVMSSLSNIFKFTTDVDYCLNNDTNKYLFIVRYFKTRYAQTEDNIDLICQLKDRYLKVFFFDDSDGADSIHFELINYVDAYYKRQLLKDRSNYLRPMYRRQLYSDYYHTKYDVVDDKETIRPPIQNPTHLNRLKIAWNIGLGFYGSPIRPTHQAAFSRRENAVQARFDYKVYPNSIGYQRRLFLKLIKSRPEFRLEYIDKCSYTDELRTIKAVLSPFGYGEICHRDFEAFIAGAVLIKPSMDHVETWPNFYLANETYFEVDWDGDNLTAVCESVLSDEVRSHNYAAAALDLYIRVLASIDSRVEELVNEFHQVGD